MRRVLTPKGHISIRMAMTPHERMLRLDNLFSHVWMVRTFLKHSDEAEDDDEA